MLSPELKARFIEAVEQPIEDRLERVIALLQESPLPTLTGLEQVAKAKRLSPVALFKIPVLLCHVAYVEPEMMLTTVDKLTEAWFTSQEDLIKSLTNTHSINKVPPALEEFFWKQVLTPPDFNQLIQTFATYNDLLDSSLKAAYTRAMTTRPGIQEAFTEGYLRPAFELEDLKNAASGTLGQAFYEYLTSHDLELNFNKGSLPRPISSIGDYVGLRTLQTHDIWHVVMGYTTTKPDELAVLGFQSAQLATTFSTHIIALAMAQTVLFKPEQLLPMMSVVAQGWRHGRQTTPLLPIKWEEMWDYPLEKVRDLHQIRPRQAQP